jgi:hypothetical protein
VKDAVGAGTMTAARSLVRPDEREVGGSSQRDRPDRFLDTRRCYIRLRRDRGSCERVPARYCGIEYNSFLCLEAVSILHDGPERSSAKLCARVLIPVQAHGIKRL